MSSQKLQLSEVKFVSFQEFRLSEARSVSFAVFRSWEELLEAASG